MAWMNRTTGESARDEANKAQFLLSQQKPSALPLSFQERGSTLLTSDVLEQTSHSQEPDKLVLTWQTINKLNKLELENSLLKESLSSLTVQMTALKEEQKQFFQMAETTMSRLDLSVSDFDRHVGNLTDANRQLRSSMNAAMNRVSDQMLEQYTETLDMAKLDLANRSSSYISQLENISRRAAKTFEAAEKRVLGFTERHVWLTLAFCGSLVGHLIGCIQWIQTLF